MARHGAWVLRCLLITDEAVVQLEMILQASEYEAAQGLDLQEFFNSTEGRFKTELGKSWAAEVVRQRAAAHAQTRKQGT